MKKRVVAMLLAGMMTVSLAACGGGSDSGSDDKKKESKKSDMKVAMVTDSGDITDQSFNQTTYEASKAWPKKMMWSSITTNRKAIMMKREMQV